MIITKVARLRSILDISFMSHILYYRLKMKVHDLSFQCIHMYIFSIVKFSQNKTYIF